MTYFTIPVLRTRELQTPRAYSLAEIELRRSELDHATRNISLWMDTPDVSSLDDPAFIISGALFRDAIIRLVECFKGEKNAALRERMMHADTPEEEMFRTLKLMRDSWASHNFGALRQTMTLLIKKENGNEIEFINTGFSVSTFSYPDKKEFGAELLLVLNAVQTRLKAYIAEEIQSVQAEAKNLTLEQIRSLPQAVAKKRCVLASWS